MPPIDAIVFDLGNVLLPFNWDIAVDRFCQRTGRTRREVDDYIVTTPFVHQLGLGQMMGEAFFATLAGDFGFDGTYSEFAEIWSDIFTVDEAMRDMAVNLKGRYPRFILSNTNAIHMDFIFSRYPFVRDFDGHILSHEVGLQKPDGRIYELTTGRFDLQPSRTVFIDDIRANVVGAQTAGWHAILHTGSASTRAELTKLGVLPI
jgi:putative hydrolase of the HAD superfamily